MGTELKTTQIMHGLLALDAVIDSKQDTGTAFTTTWDPPSLIAGASTSSAFTVTGAALGDIVICSFSNSIAGCTLTAFVSATDTVTVTLHNISGSTVNLSLGNLRIILL